jgi:putative hydrolase of the HAD superfamily
MHKNREQQPVFSRNTHHQKIQEDRMAKGPIRAVTFDLWDTVFIDDSDEPKRAAAGLPPKTIRRRELVTEYLSRHQPIRREQVDTAYDTVDAAFRQVWYEQNVTWTVPERLRVLLKGLDRELPAPEFAELVKCHEEMELEFKPDLAIGIDTALTALRGRYRLGVISDTIFSPGRVLKQLLAHYGLLDCFDGFIFSDEIGFAKPDLRVYTAAAQMLGVTPEEIVHIGDREEKDITGPQAVGAGGILTTVVVDRGAERSQADAICRDYAGLPALLADWNR